MRWRLAIALLVASLLVVPPRLGHAAGPGGSEHLDAARACYAMLDFDCARRELRHAEETRDSLDPASRIALERLGAELALSEGHEAAARDYLARLLELQPDWQPDPGSWPTPWLEALTEARAAGPDRAPPQIEVTVPLSVREGEDLVVTVATLDESGVAGVSVFVRTANAGVAAIALVTTDGQTWRGTVGSEHVVGEAVALWVEASDRLGNGPARWGSAEAPRLVAVDAPSTARAEGPEGVRPPLQQPPPVAEAPAVYETWWFWTLIGVGVAAGTGTLIYFLAESEGPSAPTTGLAVTFEWPQPPP